MPLAKGHESRFEAVCSCNELGRTGILDFLGPPSQSGIPAEYGARGLPAIILIGPEGRIVARNLRGSEIKRVVAEALRGDE